MSGEFATVLSRLDSLAGGLFLLTAFGMVATRQVLACVRLFVLQALLLAGAALLLATLLGSLHLALVAAITVLAKVLLIPWLLRRTLRAEVYTRREIAQVLNIPTALLIAAALTAFAFAAAPPLLAAAQQPLARINLPVGIAGLLLGAYTVTVRREALPQLVGLLAMENGVFFAAISIVPDLPLIGELAAAFDVPVTALVIGLLIRRIHERVGDTSVGLLAALRED